MKAVAWMAVACAVSALAVTVVAGGRDRPEIVLGMVGPLAVAAGTWVMTERTYRRNPEGLTPLMIKAFAVKVLFFGGYVAMMLAVVQLRPVPFVASFTSYFIALHLTEALMMRRLFA